VKPSGPPNADTDYRLAAKRTASDLAAPEKCS
jgi:hypothetical protein